MAEAVLSNIAAAILGDLSSEAVKPLLKEIGLLCSIKDEVEGLTGTISTIQSVLLDAEQKQDKNNQLKHWLMKLKDAVYDAEDLLDDLSTEALRRGQLTAGIVNKPTKEVRIFFSSSNQLAYAHKMGHKIKAIKKRLDKIADDRVKFQLEVHQEESRIKHPSYSLVPPVFIGRDKDKEALIGYLLNSDAEKTLVSVIAVVGLGGIGKTALVQCVFNDENVKDHFDLKMWTCISDTFDLEVILKKVLESKQFSKTEQLELNTLVNRVREQIGRKKYFLVLDDVWSEERGKWCELINILNCGAQGSKILITTRNNAVATASGATIVRNLKGLTHEESCSLFRRVAFGDGQEVVNQNLIEIGEKIAKKCCGVPLVIQSIGGILYKESSERKWIDLMNKELLEIYRATQDNTVDILSLSYNKLSSYLKQCFAYCSLFPKDYLMKVQMLEKLWIAQGFVESSTESPEVVADEYFMELYHKGFFQEVKVYDSGRIDCKMHDLMHDLAAHVSRSENTIARFNREDTFNERCRHVSFRASDLTRENFCNRLTEVKQLRSILALRLKLREHYYISKKFCDETFLRFKYLRVLRLQEAKISEVPKCVGKLKHLRYLDLSYTPIKIIPNSITKLLNLQTLRLKCCKFQELPRKIRRFVNLKHLEINGCFDLKSMPCEIGHSTSLYTLSRFHLGSKQCKHSASLIELKRLKNLTGKLAIQNLATRRDKLDPEGAYIKDTRLANLILLWYFGDDARDDRDEARDDRDEKILEELQPPSSLKTLKIHEYCGTGSPSWMTDNATLILGNLVSLDLYRCERWKQIPTFERLSHLKHLRMCYMEDLEYIQDENVSESSSAYPSLVEFKLMDCCKCKRLPSSLQKAPHLKELSLHRMYDLEYINDEIERSHPSGHLQSNCEAVLSIFPSLETLLLSHLKRLKGWWRIEDNEESIRKEFLIPSLPRLSRLYVTNCPELGGFMPLQPHLESLTLGNVNAEMVQQELQSVKVSSPCASNINSPSSSSSSQFSKLRYLEMRDIKDLERLEEELVSSLSLLNHLSINGCQNLKSFPHGIQHLPCLEVMSIPIHVEIDGDISHDDDGGCYNLPFKSLKRLEFHGVGESLPRWVQRLLLSCQQKIGDSDHFQSNLDFGNLSSLRSLTINCPDLNFLPQGIQQLRNLEEMEIDGHVEMADNLSHDHSGYVPFKSLRKLALYGTGEYIPSWVGHLTMLQELEITNSGELKSLPEWIKNLSSLQRFEIFAWGADVIEKCKKDVGEDWPKIAHIPFIKMGLDVIQDRRSR